ncbi:chemotaxis protein CheB [Mucilaginibacter lacusdianchii]|uniref:chemotaxis protein CheB n=1 Tax=Mucilaginibacter lacusdianchii TaxID=2684211 RepID=UPI00131B2991|nr:chemotaxis protein CheB [Mucilaginibacter sp. JXJ CY 39]
MALNTDLIQRWQQSEVLLLGGSAGSFKLLFRAIKSFSTDFNKTVIIIIHRKKNFFSEIEKLFAENSRMYLREISDKEEIRANAIYIAPANYHTLIEDEKQFSLDVSEPVWYSKPSIDVTFKSAADVFTNRCTAILLSGANQDGAEGLLRLQQSGALTIAQHPGDAEMPDMPNSAIQLKAADYVLHTEEIFELFRS